MRLKVGIIGQGKRRDGTAPTTGTTSLGRLAANTPERLASGAEERI